MPFTSYSIHGLPSTSGRQTARRGPIKNTSAPYKSGKGKLGKKLARRTSRRLGREDILKNPKINPLAFKVPGSMR